jgi:hypothetical protein
MTTALASSTHAALADQYFDRLAFGWQRRNRAAQSHVLDFAELSAWDMSLQACRRGLALTAPTSLKVIQRRLDEPLSRGEFFAISLHAIDVQDAKVHATCIGLVQAVASFRDIYNHALSWSNAPQVHWALDQWGQVRDNQVSTAWLHDIVALSGYQAHPELMAAGNHTAWLTVLAKACALHQDDVAPTAVGAALMQLDLAGTPSTSIQAASALLTSPVAKLRCLAAQAVLWRPKEQRNPKLVQQALDTLLALAIGNAPRDEEQAKQAVWSLACWRFADFDMVLDALAKQPEQLDLYLQALGWSGSVHAVPMVMAHLDHPRYAPLAGASLSMLTGSLPARDSWQAEPIDSPATTTGDGAEKEDFTDAIPTPKPFADLPPPDAIGFARWWSANRKNFNASTTWLAGLPDNQANLTKVLRQGKLAWRSVAARRLCAATGGPSLDTNAPAHRQRLWLAKLGKASI